MDMKDLVLTIRLRPDQLQLILVKLGACPFVEVAELISLLKSQGEAGIAAAQQQMKIQAEAPGNGIAQVRDEHGLN
jgi:hypothetical protein